MSAIEDDLLAAMRRAPDDDGLRLVYADVLLARSDPRGELIILEHRESSVGLRDPIALARLLELSAEHGFPYLPDDPDASILPFAGGGSHPVQYDLTHTDGRAYYLRWRHGFSIDVDNVTVLETDLDVPFNEWTHEETNVILAIVSDAIRANALAELTFPNAAGIRAHSHYRAGRRPLYVLPEEFRLAHAPRAQDWGLEARDRDRWHALWTRSLDRRLR